VPILPSGVRSERELQAARTEPISLPVGASFGSLDTKNVQNRAMLLTTEKIRAPVDSIRGKKDRIIDGEVVKKDDGDG